MNGLTGNPNPYQAPTGGTPLDQSVNRLKTLFWIQATLITLLSVACAIAYFALFRPTPPNTDFANSTGPFGMVIGIAIVTFFLWALLMWGLVVGWGHYLDRRFKHADPLD